MVEIKKKNDSIETLRGHQQTCNITYIGMCIDVHEWVYISKIV